MEGSYGCCVSDCHYSWPLSRTASEVCVFTCLQSKVLEAQSRNDRIAEEKSTYLKQLEEERANAAAYETRVNVKLVSPSLLLLQPSSKLHVVLCLI